MLKPRKILLAEDDSPHRERLQELLQGQGYEVMVASNGDDALHLVDQLASGAILLDIQMTLLGGCPVIRALRANPRFAGLCVIALSSYCGDVEKALHEGFDDCIARPVDGEELALMLSEQMLPAFRSRRLPTPTSPRVA